MKKIKGIFLFIFTFFYIFLVAQPVNNTCGGAIVLPVTNGSCSSPPYTNVGATTVGNPPTPSCWSPNSMSHTVWFKFIASSTSVQISTNFGYSLANTQIAVYSGNCSALTLIACNEDINTGGSLFQTSLQIHGLTVGNTYYIIVDGNGNTTGEFGVCIEEITPPGPPLPIQNCPTAQFLCDKNSLSVPDGVSGPGTIQESPSCFGAPGERASWWYSFTIKNSGTLCFTITPNTVVDYDWAMFNTTNGCMGTELSCNWSGATGTTGATGANGGTAFQDEPCIDVFAGETYTILVDRFTASASAGFSLSFAGTATFASPNPTFTANTVCLGQATQFTNTTLGSNTYSWNFGDGSTSSQQNPSHTYAATGTYTASLLVTTIPGGCQNIVNQTVVVNAAPTINAGTDVQICTGACTTLSGSSSLTASSTSIPISNSTTVSIPNNSTTGANTTVNLSGNASPNCSIQSVCFTLNHTAHADIGNNGNPDAITITMPNGTVYNSTLTQLAAFNGTKTYCIPLSVFSNYTGSLNGTWTLNVKDTRGGGGGTGSITNFSVTTTCNSIVWTPTTNMTNATSLTPSVCPTSNTTYNISALSNGCVATDAVTVNIVSGINPTFSLISNYCQNAVPSLLPTTSSNNISGTWSPNVISTASAGTQNYIFTPNAGQCALSYTLPVTIKPNPTVNSLSNVTVCPGATVTASSLSSTPAGATFAWSNNNTNIGLGASGTVSVPSFTASNTTTSAISGTVTVTPTLNSCPGAPLSYTITVNPTPTVTLPSNPTVCAGQSVSAAAFTSSPAGATYAWTNTTTSIGLLANGTGNVPQFVATNTTTAVATATVSVVPTINSCPGLTSTYTITVNPIPTMTSPTTATICSGNAVNILLTSNVPSTYSWIGNDNSNTTGESTSAQSTSTINNTITNSSTSAQIVIYTVTPTSTVGSCPGTAQQVTVTVNPVPVLSVDQTSTICSGSPLNIPISSNINPTSLSWLANNNTNTTGESTTSQTGNNINDIIVNNSPVAELLTYTITPIAGSCPGVAQQVTVTINTLPIADAGSNQVLSCNPQTVTLDGSNSSPSTLYFSWQGNNITAGINTATPTVGSTGTYTLTVTNTVTNCTNTSTVLVSASPGVPVLNMGTAPTITCRDTVVTIFGTSSSGFSYTWVNQRDSIISTLNSTQVDEPGSYTLTVTDPNNPTCPNSGVIVVNIDTLKPNISVGPGSTITCAVSSVPLSGSSTIVGATFAWTGPLGFNTVTTNTLTTIIPGTYTLTVTNPTNSCTSTITAVVSEDKTAPDVSAGDDQIIKCAPNNVTLTGSSNTTGTLTYLWTSPNNSTTSGSSIIVGETGNYQLTITNSQNGCFNTDIVAVSIDTVHPIINMVNNQIITCSQPTVILYGSSPNPAVNYLWNNILNNNTNDTILVSEDGTYSLMITDTLNGCSSTSSVIVSKDILAPNVGAGSNQVITCALPTVTITGSSTTQNVSYLWRPGGANSTNDSTHVNSTGIYTFIVTNNINGCSDSTTVTVGIDTLRPNANAGADQVLTCSVTSVTLTGYSEIPTVSYQWTPGGSTPNAINTNVGSIGTYSLEVTNTVNGCVTVDSVEVIPDASLPQLGMGDNQTITCSRDTVIISGSSNSSNIIYLWVSSVITSNDTTALVTEPGDYTLMVTDTINGCSTSGIVTVTIDTISPNANAGADQILTCSLTSVTLSADSSATGVEYIWSPLGSTQTSINVATVGQYTLTVTDTNNGCRSNDIVEVLADAGLPDLIMGQAQTLNCSVDSVIISGHSNNQNVTYLWNPPGSSPNDTLTIVTTTGVYELTVTDTTNGCRVSAYLNVNSNFNLSNVNPGIADTITCAITSATLTGSSDTINSVFTWTGPNNFSSNQASVNVNAFGDYTLTVTHPLSTCTNTAIVSVYIDTLSPPISAASTATTLTCLQDSIRLSGNSTVLGALFQWNNLNGPISGNPIDIIAPGNYTLTVVNPVNGCLSDTIINVLQDIVSPQSTAQISTPFLNCEIPEAFLTAIGNSNFNYSWTGPNAYSSNTQNPITGINIIGIYTLTVINPFNGCRSSSTVSIAQGQDPVADFIPSPVDGYVPLSVNFTNTSSAGFSGGYYWIFGNDSVSSEINPATIYENSGTYNVVLIGYGAVQACNDTVSKTIIVFPEIKLVIPNVFSPNGDGNNDEYFITSQGFKELNVTIFNRWGSIIYTFNAIGGSWDGTNGSGEDCTEGTYYYILNGYRLDKIKFESHGFITLVR